ncbi:MAG TPA: oligosaccharide flippase family protein [Acidimicrobiales bacterium]|nr:oligosaccharide flippase family protein [Acidimicrobiales bacterium]
MTAEGQRDTPLGGGLWVVASVVVPNLYVGVLSVAIDATLGAGGLGRQSVIAFAATAAITLAGSGGFIALVRSVASTHASHDRAGARHLVRWGARLHGVTGASAAALVALPALWDDDLRAAWLLAAVVTLLGTMQMVPAAVLIGCRRWREANVVGLVTGAAAVPATILVLRAGGGVAGVFAVEAVMIAVNLTVAALLARRALAGADDGARPRPEPPWRFAALSAVGVTMTVVVWRRSELLVLAALASDEEVARYSVAFGLSAILLALSERCSTVMTSTFSGLAGDGAGPLRAAGARALRVLTVAMLPVTAWTAALGPAAIRVVYGDEYHRSGAVLLVMLTTMALLPLWTVSAAVLAARGDATSPLLAGLGACVLDLVVAVPLVAAHGALGAALASVLGQLTTIGALWVVARRRVGPIPVHVASTLRAAGVAAGSGGVGWCVVVLMGGPIGLAAGVVATLSAAAVLAGVFRPLTWDDASWLSNALGARAKARTAALLHRVARHDPVVPGGQAPRPAASE